MPAVTHAPTTSCSENHGCHAPTRWLLPRRQVPLRCSQRPCRCLTGTAVSKGSHRWMSTRSLRTFQKHCCSSGQMGTPRRPRRRSSALGSRRTSQIYRCRGGTCCRNRSRFDMSIRWAEDSSRDTGCSAPHPLCRQHPRRQHRRGT
jgi:hypothetical protein